MDPNQDILGPTSYTIGDTVTVVGYATTVTNYLEDIPITIKDGNGTTIGTGTTDSQGIFSIQVTLVNEGYYDLIAYCGNDASIGYPVSVVDPFRYTND